jgi:hypothetical protein
LLGSVGTAVPIIGGRGIDAGQSRCLRVAVEVGGRNGLEGCENRSCKYYPGPY